MDPFLLSFNLRASFFTNCYWMHMYALGPHNATYTYVFRADHLTLDNQLVSLPWEELSCSQLSSSSLCRVEASRAFLCPLWHVRWCHLCSSPSAHIWVDMLVRIYAIAPDINGKHSFTDKAPILLLLQSFCPLFHDVSQVLGVGFLFVCFV